MEVQSLKYRKAFELGVGILQNPISIEGYVYALSFQVAYPLWHSLTNWGADVISWHASKQHDSVIGQFWELKVDKRRWYNEQQAVYLEVYHSEICC